MTFFWANIEYLPPPQYLYDNINRVLAIRSETNQTNEAFSRIIIDQILISAVYEETSLQTSREGESSQPDIPAVLELQHETRFQREVIYNGKTRLLSGYADCTVWYDSPDKSNFATSLVVVEAKKRDHTDTCLGQLTVYMGVVHASRKDQKKSNSAVYGVASDGLKFRFCQIDSDGNWGTGHYFGRRPDILDFQIFNRDSCVIISLHHQEPRSEREGPCLVWKSKAYPPL